MGRGFSGLFRRLRGKPPRWKYRHGVKIEYDKRKDVLTLSDYDSFQGRNSATIGLFLQAFRTVRGQLMSFRAHMNTGDQPSKTKSWPQLAYCRREDQTDVILMPDFVFWGWPEVGILDYAELTSQMLAAGAEKPTDDRLFWIGNPHTHPTRRVLLDLAKGKSTMKVGTVEWQKAATSGKAGDSAMLVQGSPFVSLPDHCRYKYLIDLQGIGYSARLKVLFFSRRLLFLQDRPWHEFYFADLVPFRHYVPVEESLEDLEDKLAWARTHEAEAEEIVAAATDFAMQHLTRKAAIDYFRKLILTNFGG